MSKIGKTVKPAVHRVEAQKQTMVGASAKAIVPAKVEKNIEIADTFAKEKQLDSAIVKNIRENFPNTSINCRAIIQGNREAIYVVEIDKAGRENHRLENCSEQYKLRDDLLDAFGDQKVFGKPIGNDIVTNKKTYLYIMAYNLANAKQKEALDTAFGLSNNEEKVKSVMQVFNELNIREVTEQKIEEYYEKSLSFLDAISVPKNQKEELYRFAKGLSLRNV